MRDDGASASTDIGERSLLRDERPEQHRGQQEAGGRDAGGDESAPSAVGPHAVQAEGDGAGNAAHPTGQSRLLTPP